MYSFLLFPKAKNVKKKKNTALEIALNTFCFIIGEDILSKFSFVYCVGLQWSQGVDCKTACRFCYSHLF